MKIPGTNVPVEKQKDFYASLEQLRSFQKRPVLGKCMYWAGNCAETPIASHIISESWLRQIADTTNHVIRFDLVINQVSQNGAGFEIRRVGVGQKIAVTFPGFCQKHDNELFACLEQEEFTASPQQIWALTYRSVCREACAKHQMVGCHLPRALDTPAPTKYGLQIIQEMKNCIDLLMWKQDLEEMKENGKSILDGYVISVKTRPEFLVAGTFSFPQTFTGRMLDARFEWMTFNILPIKAGGFVLFSWSKRSPKNASRLVKSFLPIPENLKPTALLNFALEVSENIFISPNWWDTLTNVQQEGIIKRYSRSITAKIPKPPAGSLIPSTPIIQWKIGSSAYI